MRRIAAAYRSRPWRVGIGVLVLANSLVLGGLTAFPEGTGPFASLDRTDDAMLLVLVADALACLVANRMRPRGWDLFDVVVTLGSLVPHVATLSALRAFRVIRVLRLLSFVPHARATIDALLQALRGMVAALLVLVVVFYIFTIVATNLFRDIDPVHYGDLGRSAIYLYAIMASFGSDLSAILPVVRQAPWAWLLFAPFIVVTSFGLLNLFIAVLVAALRDQLNRAQAEAEAERARAVTTSLARIERELACLAGRGPAA